MRSLACIAVFGCTLLGLSLTPGKMRAQAQRQQLDQQHTNDVSLEGPAIYMLVTDQLPRRDLRKLVTNARTALDHPDLAEYYRRESKRLQTESKEYEQFAHAAGDTTPLSEPNHYGVTRTARFDYLVAKDALRKAHNESLLAALNAQAAQGEGCFTCHSFHGRGGKVGPDLGVEGTRKRSDAWLIGHFKDPQAHSPSSVMPAFGSLPIRQLDALTSFLQYQKQQ